MTGMRRLLALDLDGTLLRPDGSIDPVDAAAIALAKKHGVFVTLATGRLVTGTLPTARTLALEHPLVCADGAAVVDAQTGEILERLELALHHVEQMLPRLRRHGLVPLIFLHDEIHCDESAAPFARYARAWTREVAIHVRLEDAPDWRTREGIVMAVGIGTSASTELAWDERHLTQSQWSWSRFQMGQGPWVVRAQPDGCTKGAALARLAIRLGVECANVAVVGDHYNDISMFQWAGRSFVMGQAPEEVKVHATDRLAATSQTGGGVAEAIERWLSL